MRRIHRNVAAGICTATAAFCLVLGAAGVLAAPAAAPSVSAAPSAAAKAPSSGKAAPTAPAKPDDPAKVAAAKLFVRLYRPRTDPLNVAAMLDRTAPRMAAAAKRNDPKLDVKAYTRNVKARGMEHAMLVLDIQAHVVSRHFTLAELNQLIAFCRSPLGQKLIAQTPPIQFEVLMEERNKRMPPLPRQLLHPSGPPMLKGGPQPASPASPKASSAPRPAGK